MRRLIEDHCPLFRGQFSQMGLPSFFQWQKPLKNKSIGWKAGFDKRGYEGRWTRRTLYFQTGMDASSRDKKARVRDSRSTCVGDQSHLLALLQPFYKICKNFVFIKIVKALKGFGDIVML